MQSWNYSTTNVDIVYSTFMETIQDAVDQVAPNKSVFLQKRLWINSTH